LRVDMGSYISVIPRNTVLKSDRKIWRQKSSKKTSFFQRRKRCVPLRTGKLYTNGSRSGRESNDDPRS